MLKRRKIFAIPVMKKLQRLESGCNFFAIPHGTILIISERKVQEFLADPSDNKIA